MDAHTRHSDHPLCSAFSYKKCGSFLLLLVGLIILASGVVTLVIIFILKPRKPSFSPQTVNIDSYKLDAVSDSALFVSSVASMTLNAQNPNKVGIRYSHSRLHILGGGLVVGMIRIPEFYQPAQSLNTSFEISIFFQSLDISSIMSGADASNFTIRILGDIGVRLRLFHITLPKIKVALDCDIAVDSRYLTSADGLSSLKVTKNDLAHFAANTRAFSTKCSNSVYF